MWWFMGYVAICALSGGFFGRLLTLVQLLVFSWVASSLLEKEKLARDVLLVFSAATAMLTIGMFLDLPGFSQTVSSREGERVSALGHSGNILSTLIALAAVILIGLGLNEAYKSLVTKTFLVVLTLPLLAGIASTGSRGGIASFMIGCAAYMLPYWRSKHRIAAMVLAACGMVAMVYFVFHSPIASTRWQMTFEEGHSSGREKIYPAAIDMFLERPVFGWQPVEFQKELATRLGEIWGQKDAHSLYFHLLLEVGAVGAIPFLVGLWLCGRAAWRARKGSFGPLPLALFLTVLVTNMTATGLARKSLWLVLALTLAAESAAASNRQKPQPRIVSTNRYLSRSV
jgi:O-antigen ligase